MGDELLDFWLFRSFEGTGSVYSACISTGVYSALMKNDDSLGGDRSQLVVFLR